MKTNPDRNAGRGFSSLLQEPARDGGRRRSAPAANLSSLPVRLRECFSGETAELDLVCFRHSTMVDLLRAKIDFIQARDRCDLEAYEKALNAIMHAENLLTLIDAELTEMHA